MSARSRRVNMNSRGFHAVSTHRRLVSTIVLITALAALGGCSERGSMPTTPAVAPALRVAPLDGATGVRLDAPVVLDFGIQVAPSVVASGVRLISEYDMNVNCPDSTMGPHGSMDMVMSDSTMLRHMAQFHATPGHYAWDAAGTVCTFRPDSLMRGMTRYMVYMSGAMLQIMQHMGGSMMSGGGMMGGGTMSGSMMRDGAMVAHFTTMSADGHAGHH